MFDIRCCGQLLLEQLDRFCRIGRNENAGVARAVRNLRLETRQHALAGEAIDRPADARLALALMPFEMARSLDRKLEACPYITEDFDSDCGGAAVDQFDEMADQSHRLVSIADFIRDPARVHGLSPC